MSSAVPQLDPDVLRNPALRPRTVRQAVRVIMVDPDQRILLFRDSDPYLPHLHFWTTPGGGIDPGETAPAAAVREVWEETGASITEPDLVGPLASRRVIHGWSDAVLDQEEVFFRVRVPAFTVDTSGFTAEERITMQEHRWWPQAELASTKTWVWPAQLLAILAASPQQPLDLGVETSESTVPANELSD